MLTSKQMIRPIRIEGVSIGYVQPVLQAGQQLGTCLTECTQPAFDHSNREFESLSFV